MPRAASATVKNPINNVKRACRRPSNLRKQALNNECRLDLDLHISQLSLQRKDTESIMAHVRVFEGKVLVPDLSHSYKVI